ncbi:putative oligopeptide transporter, OPT superfamily [Arabidopsis thaliana]|jgi:OPT family oligopeptide transporter|uniref:Probable metal-nicotianamine transporter YSL8 n=4 Tax=Arabidopsis TaxID=3701 RepID=YSL8_ARATH|nr:YELLOW STRIPE like 8 [Arabidopsis thaliana]Q6R3K4.2 RecName: Full=Probable metal-nicotianamine transporter YSL8; AltName: Full=Protein YELLOW STRIPE LIKE 8; Short=AtYSL8 [Arabidopsis thaliana]KAG7648941.1 Oligopeptide transporter OPT superfamily [Arabidopsis thaliana x Arabidopsis arenosa]AAK62655.1 At1g48370/F11A17_27 [Arabidopsis thaliana]AAQ65095.1 At1g48370/F11A17_27 [Arabidopsis thaliana]AEE32281.1 YELLOW STRIPE like 8 [Arabidopsis thaliana]OAP12245.1 YSL8 [Arabidopsis thaliana]|eukprot:NP_564525.1 YELLOW STRIPE like 8 [Arabidopsis thaliana]
MRKGGLTPDRDRQIEEHELQETGISPDIERLKRNINATPYQREEEEEDREEQEESVEGIFESREVPSWKKQLTIRAFVVSFALSILFSFIVMKLNLTTGIIPSLNVSAGLLGFFFVKTWTKMLHKSGLLKQPFTRQENTVIQTCVVASSGIAFSGGFGTYLFAMSHRIADQSGDVARGVKDPSLGWMIAFLFVVSFLGLFSVVPLRKIMIIDFKLPYPSGTATAHLINSFHTPQGAKLAKKQVRVLGKFFSFSFFWGFFQWFFTAGENCGFNSFPTFGLRAYQYKFYFDFSATYVGVGMICPYIINISLLLGGILSWGLMWPLIETRKGDWFPSNVDSSSMNGLQAYKVFIAVATILGDGLYNFCKVLIRTFSGLISQIRGKAGSRSSLAHKEDPPASPASPLTPRISYDDQRRTRFFLKDQIPSWFAVGGYVVISAVSTAILPHMFSQLRWYYIIVIYIFAPILAFCNAYGAGLTDWSLASTYGKLAIFTIGAWAGSDHGGLLAGLAACGVMMNIVSTASDLTQDFKTGYLTLSSPRAMFVSQVIGTAMGCLVSPCVFWLFYKAFDDLGLPNSEYPAPFATVYRSMAKLGVEGVSSLPRDCLMLCYVFFGVAILINLIKDCLGNRWGRFVPLPMAMAIPFFLGPYFAIDMCVGSFILFVWERLDAPKAEAFATAVASGLICGDGIWTLPSSVLAIAGVKPPICMKFLSAATNHRVDKFLQGSS